MRQLNDRRVEERKMNNWVDGWMDGWTGGWTDV